MRALITGACGFIGSSLARRLAADGHEVVAADDFSSARWSNLSDFAGDIVTVDVAADPSPLHRRGRFDIIFHQASITDTTVVDQRKMMHNNVEGFRNILDCAGQWKSRVVWASSASIYGQGPAPMKESQPSQPLNVYAFSKLAMEHLAGRFAASHPAPVIGLRYFNVYGPGEHHKGSFASMIHQLALQMRSGRRPRVFTAGQQRRDFVHIDDVVQGNLKAAGASASGIYNIGSGRGESFNQVIAELNKVLKTNLQPEYFDNPYTFTQDWTQADLTAARAALGYEPQWDLAGGIAAYHASGKLGTAI